MALTPPSTKPGGKRAHASALDSSPRHGGKSPCHTRRKLLYSDSDKMTRKVCMSKFQSSGTGRER